MPNMKFESLMAPFERLNRFILETQSKTGPAIEWYLLETCPACSGNVGGNI
jgi:hypothetical protein